MKEKSSIQITLNDYELKSITSSQSNGAIIFTKFKQDYPGMDLSVFYNNKKLSLNPQSFNSHNEILKLIHYKVYDFLKGRDKNLHWCEENHNYWGVTAKKDLRYSISKNSNYYHAKRQQQNIYFNSKDTQHLAAAAIYLLENNKSDKDNINYKTIDEAITACENDYQLFLNKDKEFSWVYGLGGTKIYATVKNCSYTIKGVTGQRQYKNFHYRQIKFI